MAETPIALTRKAADYLRTKGVEGARLDAELLLAGVLGVARLDLYLQHERPLEPAELDRYREMVRRRAHREPLQYITGEAAFRHLVLKVDRRVLIPRPETEVLVGGVLRWAAGRSAQGGAASAVDIGTGSGAIALSLAREGPFSRVVATDVSAEALQVAAENVERAGLAGRVELRQGGLWDALGEEGERFDVVVSNPPYIAERERSGLAPEVREWEPAAALFAGADGLEVLRALVAGAPQRLCPGGLLALEVGYGQAAAVAGDAERTGAYASIRVERDLAGRERVVLAELA